MTISELNVYMKDFAIEYFYLRIGVLKSRPKVANPKRIRVSRAGLDMYECRCAGKSSKKTTPALRQSFSIACGCRATFRINFLAGYYHAENKELHLAVHADKRVIVAWSWKHQHDFDDQEFFRKLSLSKIAKEALKEAVLKHGLTGSQIRHMQEVVRTKSKELSTWELMKVQNRHLRYILSQNP